MLYTVNYINDEVMSYSTPDDTHIKYPGGKWDLETLTNLCNYDGETYAQEYMKTRTNKDLYREQQEQLAKIKVLYQKINNSEKE